MRAREVLRLEVLSSEHFLAVVLGYPPSARNAHASVDSMLERFSPRGSAGGTRDGPPVARE